MTSRLHNQGFIGNMGNLFVGNIMRIQQRLEKMMGQLATINASLDLNKILRRNILEEFKSTNIDEPCVGIQYNYQCQLPSQKILRRIILEEFKSTKLDEPYAGIQHKNPK